MKKMDEDFVRGGFLYHRMWREGNVAVYGQKRPEWADYFRYEVVILREQGEREMFGKVLRASEKYPSSEEWGRFGWTYTDLRAALEKARGLIVGQTEKEGGVCKNGGVA